ncbi:Vacuolar protein sorting-associated protein 5 [Aspergillus wentii]|nr:Vacuolar protein sorting-associated protein 5 [Aspergillus wentii]
MDLDAGDSPWGDVPSQSTNLSASKQDNDENSTSPFYLPGKTHGELKLIARSPRTTRTNQLEPPSFATTKLEAVDDTVDPLGPLGESTAVESSLSPSEEAPAPPQKEPFAARNARPTSSTSQTSSGAALADSVNLEEDGAGFRGPPPVQPPTDAAGTKRQSQPSVSIEQAAKPTFEITVGDPHKTSSKAYRQPEFAVTRRYRDFLWLYNSLHGNNPGVVVPPPPEKQAVGRFDTNFVESRRAALERMLNKTASHPILQHDADLKIFLESETFTIDVKNKENREPDLGQNKGMFSSFGISVGGGGKFVEHDDWFHDRKIYLDALENQLKALLKGIDTVVTQRKGLADAAGDFSASLHALAAVELSPALSSPLDGLSDLQLRIRELYERQAQHDILTLGITIDEYIRLIGSVKTAFSQRQKAYHTWHAAESDMQKRKHTQEKLLRQGKTQQDRLNQANADVADAERKVHQTKLLFEDMGKLMRSELQRFEREKVEDFKSGVETFLESAVEAQKELIELWETFLMQLDAGEESNPFYSSIPAAGDAPATESGSTEAASVTTGGEDA